MLESLVFFVMVSAIIVIFLNDFRELFKKLFAIRGVALLLPLIVVTSLLVSFESFVLWFVLNAQIVTISMTHFVAGLLPFQWGALQVTGVILIMALTMLPMLAINAWNKRRPAYQIMTNLWVLGFVTWIISSALFALTLF